VDSQSRIAFPKTLRSMYSCSKPVQPITMSLGSKYHSLPDKASVVLWTGTYRRYLRHIWTAGPVHSPKAEFSVVVPSSTPCCRTEAALAITTTG
jgi:hypothetical protein